MVTSPGQFSTTCAEHLSHKLMVEVYGESRNVQQTAVVHRRTETSISLYGRGGEEEGGERLTRAINAHNMCHCKLLSSWL